MARSRFQPLGCSFNANGHFGFLPVTKIKCPRYAAPKDFISSSTFVDFQSFSDENWGRNHRVGG